MVLMCQALKQTRTAILTNKHTHTLSAKTEIFQHELCRVTSQKDAISIDLHTSIINFDT